MSALDQEQQQNTHKNKESHISLASLSLVPSPPPPPSRRSKGLGGPTLLDIIKQEEPKQGAGYKEIINHKDRRSWKSFRDKLRLKRAGAAWTSSLRIPASDINLNYRRNSNIGTHRNTVRFNLPESSAQEMTQPGDDDGFGTKPPPLSRRASSRVGSGFQPDENDSSQSGNNNAGVQGFRPGISRHNSARMPSSEEGGGQWDGGRRAPMTLGEERQMSAREAAAAQEAAEAASLEDENDYTSGGGGGEEDEPMKMSLMDLMGTGYLMGDDDEDYEDDDEDDPMEEEDETNVEHSCCVCMVKHKGAPSTPCGHTFCRMCSRELTVQKGNCPICKKFILEILDIF